MPLKPVFFVFLLFLERLAYAYFKLICSWIFKPNCSMERDEGGIFSKAPD